MFKKLKVTMSQLVTLAFDLPGLQNKTNYPNEGYVPVPNKALPNYYQEGLKSIIETLGFIYDPTDYTITVKVDNGLYVASYGPAIFKDESNVPVVIWGNRKIPVTTLTNLASQGLIDLSIEKDDDGIYVYLEVNNYLIALKLFLKEYQSDKLPKSAEIKRYLFNDPGTLNNLLKEKGTSFYKLHEVALGHYKVTKVLRKPGNYGTIFSLVASPVSSDTEPSKYLEEFAPADLTSESGKVFSGNTEYLIAGASSINVRLKNLGDSVEEINESKPARLIVNGIVANGNNSNGSTKYKISATFLAPASGKEEVEVFDW